MVPLMNERIAQEKEQTDDTHMSGAIIHHHRIIIEERDQPG